MPDDDLASRISRQVFMGSLLPEIQSARLSWAAGRLAQLMRDVYARAGDTLYRAGETAEEYFFLVSGEVRLTAEGKPPWTFGPRSVLGNLDVLLDRPRVRTAVATTDVHLLQLRADDWMEVLEDNFDLTRAVIRNIATMVHAFRVGLAPTGGFPDPGAEEASAPPRVALNLVDRILVLRRAAPLSRAGIQTLASLAEYADEVRFGAAETVFAPADGLDRIFVVAHGELELTRDEPAMRTRFGAGRVVGGAAALSDMAPYAARAVTPLVVLRFHVEDFFDVMEEHFDLARSVLMYLGTTNERLRDAAAKPP